ncbi:MAG: hypothetical protein ACRD2N_04025, partial [Vicinamibacterales bacterium]
QTWSGGLQHEIVPATMVAVNYMGSWTRGADNATVHNVPEPGPGSIQARRPIPQLGAIRSIRFDGKSIYHGLTVNAERRLRNDHSYNLSYTLSTSKDDASSPGPTEAEANLPQNVRNVFDQTGEWAHSSFDHRHLFVASGMYQLPFFRGRGGMAEALLGGWRLNGVFFAQSGAPFTVNLGVDQANIGAGPAQRPDQLRDPNLPADQRRAERWFDTAAFVLQAPFTFGNAPRRDWSWIHQPGPGARQNLDLRQGATARVALGSLQRVEQGELRSTESDLRHTELRSNLQRQGSSRDAVRRQGELLDSGWLWAAVIRTLASSCASCVTPAEQSLTK